MEIPTGDGGTAAVAQATRMVGREELVRVQSGGPEKNATEESDFDGAGEDMHRRLSRRLREKSPSPSLIDLGCGGAG